MTAAVGAGPVPVAGDVVAVHGNLTRRVLSVRPQGGRVSHHFGVEVELVAGTFRVQPGALARIRRSGHREICARLHGTVARWEPATVDRYKGHPAWTRVTFNPHRADSFTLPDGTPVTDAPRAVAVAVPGATSLTRVEVYVPAVPRP